MVTAPGHPLTTNAEPCTGPAAKLSDHVGYHWWRLHHFTRTMVLPLAFPVFPRVQHVTPQRLSFLQVLMLLLRKVIQPEGTSTPMEDAGEANDAERSFELTVTHEYVEPFGSEVQVRCTHTHVHTLTGRAQDCGAHGDG